MNRPMQRQLKFRLWYGEGKKWATGNGFAVDMDGNVVCPTTGKGLSKASDSFVLSQWTGLTDKNGKDVYEGDVVLIDNDDYDPSEGDDPKIITTVEFDIGRFTLTGGKHSHYRDLYEYWEEGTKLDGEVIGNIYENPKLLSHDCDAYELKEGDV